MQLERLRDELLGPDGQPRTGAVQSQPLQAPLPLDLTAAEQQLLEAYAGKVAGWGWRWQPAQTCRSGGGGARGSGAGRTWSSVPLLTHAPRLWGATLSATDLKVRWTCIRGI